MPTYVGWDEPSDKGNKGQGGQFLKLEAGKKYKVRLVSKAVRYFQHWDPVICRSPGVDEKTGQTQDPLMLQGYTPKARYAIWVFDREDQNKLKVMDFPPTLFDQFADWRANFNEDPGGLNGPDWIIKLEIPGTDRRRTKYKASYLDKVAFTEAELALLKESDLKGKLAELRKENTPEEIRQLLSAKQGGDPTGPSAVSAPAPAPAPAAAKPATEQSKPASSDGFDF